MEPGGDLIGHMGIDLGGLDTVMAEQFLDDSDILAVLQKMSGI